MSLKLLKKKNDERRNRVGESLRQAQHQSARVSSEVAEVANRPKKRPGRRARSSMTIRRLVMLV
jgi:hypothetical protein